MTPRISIISRQRPRPPASRFPPGRELRCPCGALVARLVDGRIELRCRRCKRVEWIEIGPVRADQKIAIHT